VPRALEEELVDIATLLLLAHGLERGRAHRVPSFALALGVRVAMESGVRAKRGADNCTTVRSGVYGGQLGDATAWSTGLSLASF
jgi:hypothetical protein